jgi:OFA family oxalate/formate antiporter-like MFS transporter
MLGGFYVVALFVLGALMKTAPAGFTPEGWQPSGKAQQALNIPDKNWRGLLRDPLYYLLAGMILVGGISGMIIIAHASPILQLVGGYSAAVAGSFVGILALCNSAGRVGWGVISDRFGRMPTMVVIYAFLGAAMFWLASTPFAVLVPVLIAGMAFGGFMGQLASLAADAFGSKYLPINFGMMFVPFAIAAMIGPRLAGSIKVSTGAYTNAFFIASILCLFGIGLAVVARNVMQRRMNEAAGSVGQSSIEQVCKQA